MKYLVAIFSSFLISISAAAHTITVYNQAHSWGLKNFQDVIEVKFCPRNIFKPCETPLLLNSVADVYIGMWVSADMAGDRYDFEQVKGSLAVSDDSQDILVIANRGSNKLWTDDPRCTRAGLVTIDQEKLSHSTCDGARPKWHFRAFNFRGAPS